MFAVSLASWPEGNFGHSESQKQTLRYPLVKIGCAPKHGDKQAGDGGDVIAEGSDEEIGEGDDAADEDDVTDVEGAVV